MELLLGILSNHGLDSKSGFIDFTYGKEDNIHLNYSMEEPNKNENILHSVFIQFHIIILF